MLDRLQNINKNSRATSFDSYDFATLYTNIPHDALKKNIRVLVREALLLIRTRNDSITSYMHSNNYHFGEPSLILRLHLHEDVFASKRTLYYAFTLPVYTKTVKMQIGNA